MISWFKYPFIRLLIPFALGIWLAFSFDAISLGRNGVVVLLIILSLLLLLLVLISLFIKDHSNRWIFYAVLFFYLLLLGVLRVGMKDYELQANDISKYAASEYYVARLLECPTIKDKSIKAILEIMAARTNDDTFDDVDSKIIAYFEKGKNSLDIKYGDCILIFKTPEEVEKPPNPEQFDYKDYLYKKGITHQIYLKNDDWIDLDYNKANSIYRFSYYVRDFLLRTMSRLGIKDKEYAVAAAILLGYDDSLPHDLRQKYVAAGAMHILCVSGLHVGVIFMVFSYMLFFLNDSNKAQRIIKQILLLFLIWFYAMIAGLAPSILRATIMLSFVIFGNIISRKGILLNSLAASAFILLCINPANLFDVGFLLSYVAVVGIVVMQMPIKKMFYFKYDILNKIWEITSVTIAAQIATMPFTIYYFHQFPLYFWLSNLFMTPISSVVIIGGMIMLLVFFIPYVSNLVACLVKKIICVMNIGVSWVESLPYSIIEGLYIDELQFLILLLALLAILFYAEFKSPRMLIFIMTMMFTFLIVNLDNVYKQHNQKKAVIYSINNMTAVDFINGRSHLLMADSAFIDDESAFSYNIENYLVSNGTFHNGEIFYLNDDFNRFFVKKRKNVVTFDGKLIGLSDGREFYNEEPDYKIPLDYMIVYGRGRCRLSTLLKMYSFDNLIIDGSVPRYLVRKLADEASSLGIEFHDIGEEGAFLIQ